MKRILNTQFLYSAGFQFRRQMDISGLRKQCKNNDKTFLEKDLVYKEPFSQFKAWYEELCTKKVVLFPGAMCLATVSAEGFPSARYVICTSYEKDGFKFFTDYGSKKSREMDHNPNVAATFYWNVLDRSVRIEGQAEKLSDEESQAAFKSRPIDSQIAVWSSSQSLPIESKQLLREQENEKRTEFLTPGKEIPKPNYWYPNNNPPLDTFSNAHAVEVFYQVLFDPIKGGYLIRPKAVEFSQGQANQLSDRIRFRKLKDQERPDGIILHEGVDGWVYERLSP